VDVAGRRAVRRRSGDELGVTGPSSGYVCLTMVIVARIVSAIFFLIVGIIVLGILFYIFGANPANPVVNFVAQAADFLVTPFRFIFLLANNNAQVAINWGIGALIYLVVGALITGVLSAGRRRRRP